MNLGFYVNIKLLIFSGIKTQDKYYEAKILYMLEFLLANIQRYITEFRLHREVYNSGRWPGISNFDQDIGHE